MINYKEAVRTHTSGLKPKTVAYCNFGKGTGRDANIYMNERTRNVVLDNTKEQREKARAEAKELKKKFPGVLSPHTFN